MRTLSLCKLALLGLATVAVLRSQSKAPQKENVLTGFAISPIVFKDEACARDYVQASARGGLEGRKSLIEQAAVGCFDKPDHVYWVISGSSGKVTTGKQVVVVRRAMMVRDIDLEEMLKKTPSEPGVDSLSVDGWLLDSQILRVTREKLVDSIKRTSH